MEKSIGHNADEAEDKSGNRCAADYDWYREKNRKNDNQGDKEYKLIKLYGRIF